MCVASSRIHWNIFFNETHHAVTQYIWLPLLPRNKMRRDELFVAAVEILETFGFIPDSKSASDIVPVPGGEWQKLFQYGDVLTIQKLHQLNPGVMKKITHIGKELDSKTLYYFIKRTSFLRKMDLQMCTTGCDGQRVPGKLPQV